jgi:hypothetical protein
MEKLRPIRHFRFFVVVVVIVIVVVLQIPPF